MFFIPGQLIAAVTFPGVIIHVIAQQLLCRLQRLAVLDVCYYRVGRPVGYLIHESPRHPVQSLLIVIGPFLVNTIVGALIAFPAALPALKFGQGSPLEYLLIWLGISIAMHSFPSTGDGRNILKACSGHGVAIVWRLIAWLVVVLIWVGAIGSRFWLDLIYGIGVAMLLPTIVVALLR